MFLDKNNRPARHVILLDLPGKVFVQLGVDVVPDVWFVTTNDLAQ
jgi:hypothetical protein